MANADDKAQSESQGSDADREADGASKPQRVFVDEVKAQHTTHWDRDVMSRDELEALYRVQRQSRRRRHLLMVVGGVLGVVLVIACGWLWLAR